MSPIYPNQFWKKKNEKKKWNHNCENSSYATHWTKTLNPYADRLKQWAPHPPLMTNNRRSNSSRSRLTYQVPFDLGLNHIFYCRYVVWFDNKSKLRFKPSIESDCLGRLIIYVWLKFIIYWVLFMSDWFLVSVDWL